MRAHRVTGQSGDTGLSELFVIELGIARYRRLVAAMKARGRGGVARWRSCWRCLRLALDIDAQRDRGSGLQVS